MRVRILPLLLLLILPACASRGSLADTTDPDALFEHGMERLSAGKWAEAVEAFEGFSLNYASHPRAAEARFRLGEAFMGRKEYVTAATEFNRLATEFPLGPWADDSRYMVCAAYSELAPRPQLDQEYTHSAIEHCRSLINYYPESSFVPQAQEQIEQLTSRLAEKEYEAGEYYFRRRAYDSGILYFESVANDYRETPWAARALLRMYESYQRLDYEQEARETRERLLREHPESPEARQLNGAGTPPTS